jgi:hypothetical protein
MKVMSKETRLSPEKVIERAKEMFNSKYGLKVTQESPGCCIDFASDIGFVTVQVNNDKGHTEVKVTTREWEYQVGEFLKNLK